MNSPYMRLANTKGNLMNQAYQAIKDAICNNEVTPGDILSENQIAKELGMSRTPVREALRMLASEDYIEVRNGTGIFVKTISKEDMHNLMQVRKSLEMLASETAVFNIKESEIQELEQSFLTMMDLHKKKQPLSVQEFTTRDFQLHELLVDRCSNKYVKNIMSSIYANIKRFQCMSFVSLNNLTESTEQHLYLLRLLREHDSQALASALAKHIDWAQDCVVG